MEYRYSLLGEVAEFFSGLSVRNRERCLDLFRAIAEDPFQTGDTFTRDSVGRHIQHKFEAGWEISFWADHPIKEIRIVGLRRIPRR